jgi:hypothetical protein
VKNFSKFGPRQCNKFSQRNTFLTNLINQLLKKKEPQIVKMHMYSSYIQMKLKNQICGLKLPKEPYGSTRLMKLTGR